MKAEILFRFNALRAARCPVALVSDFDAGTHEVLCEGEELARHRFAAAVRARLASGESGFVESLQEAGSPGNPGRTGGAGQVFVQISLPPPLLLVVGAVHIAQSMAGMARHLGLDMTIIDPRRGFATRERFADTPLIAKWPEDARHEIVLDSRTALIALSHDPKIDDFLLIEALRAPCFYVGALGSRKTHTKRIARLRAAGLAQKAIDRIHAPVGLDIGARSPAGIALAILAEIVAVLHGRPGR